MKKTLFLAMTADGLIAKTNDEVTWSEDVWRNYFEYCNTVGYLIVGRRTFELMAQSGELDNLILKELLVISMRPQPAGTSGTWFTSPVEAIYYLESKGCGHVVIGGGRTIANAMLSEGLLDELQFDIEPKLYGSGVPLFGELPGEFNLKLIETRRAGLNTVRVLYALAGPAT